MWCKYQLEYPAVYGRASMAAFHQLSTHIVPPPSNVWEVRSQHMDKSLTVNPYMSLLNLKLCSYIRSTNINFRPPLTLDFLVHLGLNFHPGWFAGGGGSNGPATNFCHGRTETWLLKSRLAACERCN